MNNLEFIKQIDIKELINKETGLQFKKNTLEYCPFCKSGTGTNKSPAFSVKPNSNIFTCFVCEKKGNPIEFIKFHKNLQNNEAVKYLAENHANLPKFEHVPEAETDLSKKIYAISKNSKQKATEYLQSRKINTDKLPADCYFYDDYFESVVFVDSEKKLINQRVINPDPDKSKVMQSKGSILNNALYDKVFSPKSDTVFIVESVINAFSLYPYSSLAIFSTMNKFTDVVKLRKYLTDKKIILAFDNDVKKESDLNAGKKCTEYYLKFISENIKFESLSILLVPENKDINDLLQKDILFDFIKDSDNYDFVFADILKKPLKQNSISSNTDFSEHGFYVNKSSYYITKINNGHFAPHPVSDCVFEFLYKLNNEDSTRLVKVQQTEIDGKQRRVLVEVPNEDLTGEKFKKILSSESCSYIGTEPTLQRIFMYNKHREKQAESIETYGFQPESKMFVFSDCAISENSIIKPNSIGMINNQKTNKLYYLSAASPANEVKDKDFREHFYYKAGDIDFKEFANLFYHSNKQNGSIGTMFYLLSVFRDIVVKHLDFFPYLFLYGTAGGGKTSYAEILTSLFGDTSKGIDLKDITQAALGRIASQKRNTITYYKEYKTDALPYVEQYFKAGYDCVSRTISKNGTGKETITFTIESSGLLDSNFLPTNEEAVYSRMIILDFENATFTAEQKKAFFKLKDHKENGLTQITKEILQYRQLFEDNFKDVFYTVLEDIKNGKMKHFKDRERAFKHVALILTPFHILSNVLKFPFDIETLENIMVQHAENQYTKLNEFKSTSMFWQSLAYWKNEGKVKEFGEQFGKDKAHYIKKNHTEQNGTIYLKSTQFATLHTYYVSYCKTKNVPFESLSELKAKLFSEGYEPFIENKKENKKVFNNYNLGSSYAFTYEINKTDKNIIIEGIELDL